MRRERCRTDGRILPVCGYGKKEGRGLRRAVTAILCAVLLSGADICTVRAFSDEVTDLRETVLARALEAFSQRESALGDEDRMTLAVLSACGQALCSRISDSRFPDGLPAVCLSAFPELVSDACSPSALSVSAAREALFSPDAVNGAIYFARSGEDIGGSILCAEIGGYIFGK